MVGKHILKVAPITGVLIASVSVSLLLVAQNTPYITNKRGPDDVDESTDTYDTIDWLLKNRSGNTTHLRAA